MFIEYYFSDDHISKDKHIKNLIIETCLEGFIYLSEILSWKMMKYLNASFNDIKLLELIAKNWELDSSKMMIR
jgi:hypothetical protein